MFPEKYKNVYIVGVLECSSRYQYGYSSSGAPLYIFHPLHKDLKDYMFLVGSKNSETSKNYLVLIRYLNWNEKYPRGELIHVLGECGDWEAEKKALMWQYSPYNFKKSKDIIKSIENISTDISVTDVSSWETFNIDPEGCEDIDDCISYKLNENGSMDIAITIADVSSIIVNDTELDKRAFLLGQTMYSEKERKSMLPSEYEQLCSLKPGQERYGVSLFFTYPGFENIRFAKTKIVNNNSYTYESIYQSKHTEVMNMMKEISQSEDSHKWVESLMIFYNKEASKILVQNKVGIYKVHNEFKTETKELLHKYCPFLLNESSSYSFYTEDLYHHGLQLEYYSTLTSPIRRYADLYNQRTLLNILKDPSFRLKGSSFELKDTLEHLNHRSKETKRHDRDMFFLNLIQHNTLKQLKGVVVKISEEKVSVYIEEWKRIVCISNKEMKYILPFELEQEILLRYFFNSKEKRWKNKIIFERIL
jgi:exoribonuclease R